MTDAREALARECDLADSDMRKWVRVPVKHVREALAFESTTLPSVEDVARVILGYRPEDLQFPTDLDYSRWDSALDQARAVLALFPGRTEAEVKAEAWDEAVDTLSRHWEDFAPAAVADLERRNPYTKKEGTP